MGSKIPSRRAAPAGLPVPSAAIGPSLCQIGQAIFERLARLSGTKWPDKAAILANTLPVNRPVELPLNWPSK